MTIQEAMHARHSVRQYENRPLGDEVIAALKQEIAACNRESGLHIQLVTNEPKAFRSMMARYGKFSGVTNYLALIGRKSEDLDELCGYYGERLVLLAQQLGLNSCWVAMTYKKDPPGPGNRTGGEAAGGDRPGLRRYQREAPSLQEAGAGEFRVWPCPPVVSKRGGGSLAGSHGYEPAKVQIHSGWQPGGSQSRRGLLFQN